MKFRASADTPRGDEIQALIKVMSGALDQVAEDLRVGAGTTHVVLDDNFAAEVEATNYGSFVVYGVGSQQPEAGRESSQRDHEVHEVVGGPARAHVVDGDDARPVRWPLSG